MESTFEIRATVLYKYKIFKSVKIKIICVILNNHNFLTQNSVYAHLKGLHELLVLSAGLS